ncbi:pectinesterase [Medicago truncatula]|uniref:Pectinesterase n=1 Tax=Medicago truncatula TaxID=3880 RepID=A0A072VFQ7_MEDTR|nr:pectinesterase [Medicago truncatula]
MTRYVIFVKKGVYKGKIVIGRVKWNIVVIGEGMDPTIILGSIGCHGNKSNACTYDSTTFDVFSFFTLKKTNGEVIPNVTVAQDENGKYTKVMDAASNFTVTNFISGDQWLPLIGIPFISGLRDGNTTR